MSRYRDARNPLDQLIEQENRTCKGCIHLEQAWGRQYCKKHENKSGGNMRRCKDYREGV